MMNDCAHNGLFGVQLSNSVHLPSWWGIAFSESYDVSKYQSLNFWIKGDAGNESFLVLIKDKDNNDIEINSSSLKVKVSNLEWNLVEVPFDSSTLGTDSVTEIKSFVIGVPESDQIGTICVDDIYFSSKVQ